MALVLGIARGVSVRADARVLLMAGVVIGAFANAAIMAFGVTLMEYHLAGYFANGGA